MPRIKKEISIPPWLRLSTSFLKLPESTTIPPSSPKKKGVEATPFTCFLDLGLARATSGNRVFAALKGAVDGGLHIPHSDSIFPKVKTDKKDKKDKGDKGKEAPKEGATKGGNPLRDRIFGVHVQTYLDLLRKKPNSKGSNDQQLKNTEKNITEAKVKTLEELYKKVHTAIRANPDRVVKPAKKVVKHVRDTKDTNVVTAPSGKKYRKDFKITNQQRKQRVKEKIDKYLKERSKK